MLVFPVISVLLVYILAYIPVFARAIVISSRSTNADMGKLNARAAGRVPPDLRETLDENSFNLVHRLQASHENQLESLGIYAAGIAAALATPVRVPAINTFAAIYLAARILYSFVYALPPVANGAFRSLLFFVCVIAIVGIWITVAAAAS